MKSHSMNGAALPLVVRLPLLLSMIAGMVDLIGYLTLGNLFTAHVTGNIVAMGATLVRDTPLRLAQVMIIPMFGLAVGGAWLMARISAARGLSPRRTLLWIEFLLLTSTLLFSVFTMPSTRPHGFDAAVVAMIAVSAMGCQFALSRLTLPGAPSTSVMTGNLAGSVLSLLNRDAKAWQTIGLLAGFFGGCLVAAISVRFLKDAVWALPAGVAALALLLDRASIRD